MKCIHSTRVYNTVSQVEMSLDHWNVGFGVLWGLVSGTSVPLWLCLDCAVQQTDLPTHHGNTGLKVCPGDVCQMDSPLGSLVLSGVSGVSRASRNCPWAAFLVSVSGPAAGNWIWVQWSRGVVKAAGGARLTGLWTPDNHLLLDPACSGWTTPAGSGQSITFLKLLLVAVAQRGLAWGH